MVELSTHQGSNGKSIAESTSEGHVGEIVRRSGVSSAGSLSDRVGATTAVTSGRAKKGITINSQPMDQ